MTPTIDKLAEALKGMKELLIDPYSPNWYADFEVVKLTDAALLAYEAEKEHRPAVEVTVERLADLIEESMFYTANNKDKPNADKYAEYIAKALPSLIRIVKGGE